jgi:DUF3072 family protein
MTSQANRRRRTAVKQIPRLIPPLTPSTEKEADDWICVDEPTAGAQPCYLKTLSEEWGEPDSFQPDLTKAESSKRIDALEARRKAAQPR